MLRDTFDQQRPLCVNLGCDKKVSTTGSKYKPRYRTVCSKCHDASWGRGQYEPWVVPFKTGRCSNQNANLGWKCPTDYSLGSVAIGQTDLDHIDGNPRHNAKENLQELCPICHRVKTSLNGDTAFKKVKKPDRFGASSLNEFYD